MFLQNMIYQSNEMEKISRKSKLQVIIIENTYIKAYNKMFTICSIIIIIECYFIVNDFNYCFISYYYQLLLNYCDILT